MLDSAAIVFCVLSVRVLVVYGQNIGKLHQEIKYKTFMILVYRLKGTFALFPKRQAFEYLAGLKAVRPPGRCGVAEKHQLVILLLTFN